VIGPGGIFVIDSKQYRGRLQLDPTGRLWHGRYPLTPTLQAVSFEADQAALVLPDPDVAVVPVVAVHGAQVPWGKVVVEGVPVVATRRLLSLLRALPAVLGPERVAQLADQARVRFHAAAQPGLSRRWSPARRHLMMVWRVGSLGRWLPVSAGGVGCRATPPPGAPGRRTPPWCPPAGRRSRRRARTGVAGPAAAAAPAASPARRPHTRPPATGRGRSSRAPVARRSRRRWRPARPPRPPWPAAPRGSPGAGRLAGRALRSLRRR
jgi:hypothetical protein